MVSEDLVAELINISWSGIGAVTGQIKVGGEVANHSDLSISWEIMADVVCVGSATWDIFLKSDQFTIDRHERGVYLCEKYEGKIEAQELVMVSGGGATNAAVSYARKGLRVAVIIEMGKDVAAELILADLAKEQVDTSLVIQEDDETTAVSVILLAGKGGNSIVTYRGASRMLTVDDIPWDRLGLVLGVGGWVHLTSVGGDMELVEQIISWARENRRRVYWNPGGEEIRKVQSSKFKIQSYPDVLQLNREEASNFFGVEFIDDQVWRSEHCPTPPETLLVITDGARGGRVCHKGECFWYEGIKTTTVDSTGAGDAFGSGVVAAHLRGKDVPEAIEWGRKQAAAVVGHIGAKAGLLNWGKDG